MAHLEVQPKSRVSTWWSWLLLVAGLIVLTLFFAKACGSYENDHIATTRNSQASQDSGWNAISFNGPLLSYEEITDSSISIRGGEGYAIYSVVEELLFDSDKSAIRKEAEADLQQLAASLSKRYHEGAIRIYGYTDAKGSAGYNRELAEQRAEAVKEWLVSHAHISGESISLHAVGESNPVASNSTETGRQQNRRVEIVARTGGASSAHETKED